MIPLVTPAARFWYVQYFGTLPAAESERRNLSALTGDVFSIVKEGLVLNPFTVLSKPPELESFTIKLPLLLSVESPRFKPEAGIFAKPCPEPKKADAEISFDAERLLINDEPVTCKD